ncbi:SPASM domain-containing protein [Caldanaerobacter subterraneus]|uniref:SPASM domain-containing protein n=1 Tax=Caldanaerobacter subterraneus TaxID=911092 RepID=A0A7Y2L8H5_9THEO|nr:SPASM domain-containing protein [Caldanaerobacter subterraneus]
MFEEKYNYNISLNTIANSILSQQRYSYFCDAGINQITINSDGDIWPCPLYIGRGNYKIGNIYDDIYTINSGFKRINKMLQSVNKETHEDCRNCVASFWCTKCPAKSLIEKGKLIIDKEDYDRNIKLTELVLTKLFQIMRSGRFEEFLNKYKKLYSMEVI